MKSLNPFPKVLPFPFCFLTSSSFLLSFPSPFPFIFPPPPCLFLFSYPPSCTNFCSFRCDSFPFPSSSPFLTSSSPAPSSHPFSFSFSLHLSHPAASLHFAYSLVWSLFILELSSLQIRPSLFLLTHIIPFIIPSYPPFPPPSLLLSKIPSLSHILEEEYILPNSY